MANLNFIEQFLEESGYDTNTSTGMARLIYEFFGEAHEQLPEISDLQIIHCLLQVLRKLEEFCQSIEAAHQAGESFKQKVLHLMKSGGNQDDRDPRIATEYPGPL